MQNQLFQLFSIYSPTSASMASPLNPTNPLLYATRNATNNLSSEKKSGTLLTNISKSDRSNSSSPESFDSSRDRTSDSEKQHCSPSQSLSSSTSSYSASTKRKQAVPLSLTARLSYQQHHLDQPLNLAVNKEEDTITDCKKQKVLSPPSTE